MSNTVIIIASDHHIGVLKNGAKETYPIAFIALNTGMTKKIDRPVGQIDVFPTVLQIMNRSREWEGLGMSMLDERNASSINASGVLIGTSGKHIDSMKREAWEISDLIIRGNYFDKK